MNENDEIIVEISADYLFLIILADKKTIGEIINDINKTTKNNTIKYISQKINNSLDARKLELEEIFEKDVILDDGVEAAQCRTYAEDYKKDLYMLMSLEEDGEGLKFGFPKIDFGDEEYPENIAEKWLKQKVKKMPNGIKKNMQPIAIVGINQNILVVASKVKNKTNKISLKK
jgi:hypothetical protein